MSKSERTQLLNNRRSMTDPLGCRTALSAPTRHNASVTATTSSKVSNRGQTTLPAELRHRWGIEEGGEVGFIDLGESALIVPGGLNAARRELRRVLADRYELGLAGAVDPDLLDQ